jgi:hypothetical protein
MNTAVRHPPFVRCRRRKTRCSAGPSLLPARRFPGAIRALSVLGHETLVTVLLHQFPGVEAVGSQTPDREDQVGPVDCPLEHASALVKRLRPEIPVTYPEAVERHEDRRGADDRRVGIVKQVELADELLVEDADLAVEDEARGPELADRRCQLGKAGRVVDAVST